MVDRELQQAVPVFRNVDIYNYFLLREHLSNEDVVSLYENEEIRRSTELYMWFGLPLGATLVYISYELSKNDDLSRRFRSLIPTGSSTIHPDGHVTRIKTISDDGRIAKQIARYIAHRLGTAKPTFGPDPLVQIEYPHPLTDSSSASTRAWMKQEGIQVLADGDMRAWVETDDYPEYVDHWIKANWALYNEILGETNWQDLNGRYLSADENPHQLIIDYENTSLRTTDYLNVGMRLHLLQMIVSGFSLGLIVNDRSV